MDRRAWQDAIHGVAKSWAQLKRLSTHARIQLDMLNRGWVPTLGYKAGDWENLELLVFGVYFKAVGWEHPHCGRSERIRRRPQTWRCSSPSFTALGRREGPQTGRELQSRKETTDVRSQKKNVFKESLQRSWPDQMLKYALPGLNTQRLEMKHLLTISSTSPIHKTRKDLPPQELSTFPVGPVNEFFLHLKLLQVKHLQLEGNLQPETAISFGGGLHIPASLHHKMSPSKFHQGDKCLYTSNFCLDLPHSHPRFWKDWKTLPGAPIEWRSLG